MLNIHNTQPRLELRSFYFFEGLNCYLTADAIQNVYSQQPNYTSSPIFNDTDEPSAYIQPLDITQRALTATIPSSNLLLINYHPATDLTGLRSRVWKDMCVSNNSSKSKFFQCKSKSWGSKIEDMPNVYERHRKYFFWLSPRGRGLDCHRTWEALYLDIIPIVWNTTLNTLYEDLPILIINDHKELNEALLRDRLYEISKKKLSKGKSYHYEKLRNAYWRRMILDKSRHRDKKNIHERTEQCWIAKSTI